MINTTNEQRGSLVNYQKLINAYEKIPVSEELTHNALRVILDHFVPTVD